MEPERKSRLQKLASFLAILVAASPIALMGACIVALVVALPPLDLELVLPLAAAVAVLLLAGLLVFFVPRPASPVTRRAENFVFAAWAIGVIAFVAASQIGRGALDVENAIRALAFGLAPFALCLLAVVWAWSPTGRWAVLGRRVALYLFWSIGLLVPSLFAFIVFGPVFYAPAPPAGYSPIGMKGGSQRIAATVDFPATAMLMGRETLAISSTQAVAQNGFVPRCSGVFVSNLTLITAAHCICGVDASAERCKRLETSSGEGAPAPIFDPDNYRVFVQGTGTRKVAAILKHPQYVSFVGSDPQTYRTPEHDLALITLTEPIAVEPVALASRPIRIGETMLVAGFGRHFSFLDEIRLPAVLLAGAVPHRYGVKLHAALVASDCNIWTKGAGFHLPIVPSRSICSTAQLLPRFSPFYEIAAGPCNGDSGGPLFIAGAAWDDWNGYQLAGITSFGDPNCNLDGPFAARSMFTNVTADAAWIKENSDVSRPQAMRRLRPILNPDERFVLGSEGSPITTAKLYYPAVHAETHWRFDAKSIADALRTAQERSSDHATTVANAAAAPAQERAETSSPARHLVVTVNSSCEYDWRGVCRGDDFSLRITDPSGVEIPACHRDAGQNKEFPFVFDCRIDPPGGVWKPGQWNVYLVPTHTPDSSSRDQLDQDLQLAIVAY